MTRGIGKGWKSGAQVRTQRPRRRGEGIKEPLLTGVVQKAYRQFLWNVWTSDYQCE